MAEASVEERHSGESYGYLITVGRHTGEAHEIEIWFAARGNTIYLMNGGARRGPGRSDWVLNLRQRPEARMRIGGEPYAVRARLVEIDSEEHEVARRLLVEKYEKSAGELDDWRRTAFPVALEVVEGDQ